MMMDRIPLKELKPPRRAHLVKANTRRWPWWCVPLLLTGAAITVWYVTR